MQTPAVHIWKNIMEGAGVYVCVCGGLGISRYAYKDNCRRYCNTPIKLLSMKHMLMPWSKLNKFSMYLEYTEIAYCLFEEGTIATVVAPNSCRHDSNLVALICRQWNTLFISGGSVQMCRFSTIFATDRDWFNCISMHCSRKRQLLLCESSFHKGSWIAVPVDFSNRFTVLTFLPVYANAPLFVDVQTDCDILVFLARLCTTQNVCPFAESFWYQDLQ